MIWDIRINNTDFSRNYCSFFFSLMKDLSDYSLHGDFTFRLSWVTIRCTSHSCSSFLTSLTFIRSSWSWFSRDSCLWSSSSIAEGLSGSSRDQRDPSPGFIGGTYLQVHTRSLLSEAPVSPANFLLHRNRIFYTIHKICCAHMLTLCPWTFVFKFYIRALPMLSFNVREYLAKILRWPMKDHETSHQNVHLKQDAVPIKCAFPS